MQFHCWRWRLHRAREGSQKAGSAISTVKPTLHKFTLNNEIPFDLRGVALSDGCWVALATQCFVN